MTQRTLSVRAHRLLLWPHFLWHTLLFSPATLASAWLFFSHSLRILHWLLPLLNMLFSQMSTWWSFSHLQFFAEMSPVRWGHLRATWLRHLSPHLSPGSIQLIRLARWVSPFSLTSPSVSLPKLRTPSKRTIFPHRGGGFLSQGYKNRCIPLVEPPNKLWRYICRRR